MLYQEGAFAFATADLVMPDGVDWNRMRKMSRDNVETAQPEELAGLFAYLGSDEARYITGSVMVMDGGITA
jgi:NAD(P)-dependent dehydrogenase (short-subunit alcohol dehydrogenase family)